MERAAEAGCQCLQLFTKNCSQWSAKEISPAEIELFRQTLCHHAIEHTLVHDSYLINLASPDDVLWRRSIDAFAIELRRAEQLGIPYVVTHPGAYTCGDEQAGLRRVAAGLDEVHRLVGPLRARCLLETTAGQGTCLGHRFEHLAAILDQVQSPQRVAVCFDTCHVFAAGYPLARPDDYAATMEQFDRLVGLGQIKAFHLNDSKRELGSRVDRHEHIGQGHLGLEAFRNLLNDPRFATIPMYLETPKAPKDSLDWDRDNLQRLRGLLRKPARRGTPTGRR